MMKRLICVLFILLILCGCSKNNSGFSLNRDSLNTSFQSKLDGKEYKGRISFDEKNNMLMTITYPDVISGFSLYFDGEKVSASFDDTINIHTESDFPDNFVLLSFYDALKKSITDGAFIKNKDKAYEMTTDGVKIHADSNGNITSAELKNGYIIFTH